MTAHAPFYTVAPEVRWLDVQLREGDLDADGAELARELMDDNGPTFCQLDFARVEIVGGNALALLVRVSSQLAEKGGRLVLLNVSTELHRLFAMCGLDGVLDVRRKAAA